MQTAHADVSVIMQRDQPDQGIAQCVLSTMCILTPAELQEGMIQGY